MERQHQALEEPTCPVAGSHLSPRGRQPQIQRTVQTNSTNLSLTLRTWGIPDQSLPSSKTSWPADVDTVTIKNIPCRCRGPEILDALRSLGFGSEKLVYFHLPVKEKHDAGNLGYCFVGFRNPELAEEFCRRAKNFTFPSRQSQKVISVEPARNRRDSMTSSDNMHGEIVFFDNFVPHGVATIEASSVPSRRRSGGEDSGSGRARDYSIRLCL
ncbi:unnamed protein product [Symbiodinium natans]|uniref:RRM domain-containing protein n=1 Tax=Symbiodinium natans TaxID=878477 RepID=A0A812Q8Q3_9DINO|nr:unnamed protein product [Symbiodinium natans]